MSDEIAVESATSQGEWEGAEEAFNDPAFTETDHQETTPEPVKEVAPPEEVSHLEPPQVTAQDLLNLDDLKVPLKYKQAIKERIDKIVEDYGGKHKSELSAVAEELGQNKEAIGAFVDIFREIASDPERAADYIEKYGNQLGIDPSFAAKFRQKVEESKPPPVQQETLDTIYQKYAEPLANARDPNEFLGLMRAKDFEIAQAVKQEMMGTVGNLLKAYHQKYIEPDKKVLSDYKTKAEQEAQQQHVDSSASSWNRAYDGLKGKYSDIETYKPEISKYIKSKKTMNTARTELNKDAHDVEGRQELLEEAYLLLSRQKAMNPKPQRVGGLPPSQKHVATKKTGGDDWDDIRGDPELGW